MLRLKALIQSVMLVKIGVKITSEQHLKTFAYMYQGNIVARLGNITMIYIKFLFHFVESQGLM